MGQHGKRNWLAFFVAGTINNFGYVLVLSAASSITKSFHAENDIGLINWAVVAMGFVVKGVNTFLLENVPYSLRFIANGTVMAMGFLGVAMSLKINFAFLLVSVVLVGMASSFGEGVILGYLRAFEADQVGGWSSGTGMAGIGGSAAYLGCVALKLSNETIFMLCVPTVAVYWFALFVLVREPVYTEPMEKEGLINAATNDELNDAEVVSPATCNGEASTARILRCTRHVLSPAVQLAMVYFFEYVASVGCAAKAVQDPGTDWFRVNSYAVLSFCYQFGVFLSRSSLSIVKIRRIELLNVAQAINFALWMIQATFHVVDNVWVLFVCMVGVGLLGGAMYVNTFYIILNDPELTRKDRELCVNIVSMFITFGITAASAFEIMMDHTFL